MFDAYEELSFAESIPLQTLGASATVTGAAVQLGSGITGNFQEVLFAIDVGTWTDGTHTFEVQSSPDGSTSWDPVPAANLRGVEPVVLDATNDEGIFFVGYRVDEALGEEYVRVVVVSTGVTTGLADVQAHAILADALVKPVR